MGRHSRGTTRALIICGLALYWPLLTLCKVALSAAFGNGGASDSAWLGFSIALLAGAAALRWVPKTRRLVFERWVVPGCGLATSGLLLAGSLASPAGALGTVLGALACTLAAVTLCLLTVSWGEAMLACCEGVSRQDADEDGDTRDSGERGVARLRRLLRPTEAPFAGRLLVDVSLSLVASFAIRLVTALAMGGEPQGALGVGCLVAYPALACLPWVLYLRRLEGRQAAGHCGCNTGQAAVGVRGRERALLVTTAVFVALVSVLAGIRTAGTTLYPVDTSGARYLLALAFSGALAVCTVLMSRRPLVARAVAWGATVVLAFAGVLLTMGPNGGTSALGVNALLVARLVIWTLFWMLPIEAARDAQRPAGLHATTHADPAGHAHADSASCPGTGATGLLASYYLVPQGIAYLLTDSLFIFWPAPQGLDSMALGIVTLLVALALIACALLITALLAIQGTHAGALAVGAAPFAGSSAPSSAPTDGSAPPDGSVPNSPEDGVVPGEAPDRHAACLAIASEAGLTERETVVLECLSLGHTVQHIAQMQGVTPNTVRTHSKGLYRKLDCHSKQEIINLVDARLR